MGKKLVLKLQLLYLDAVCFCHHSVALYGMAKDPGKCAIFDLAFDQIVLSAFFHCFGRKYFVIHASQHDNRDIGACRARPPHDTPGPRDVRRVAATGATGSP